MRSADYAELGRLRKVLKLLKVVPSGATAEKNRKIGMWLAARTEHERERLARAVGVEVPSKDAWALLVEVVRDRPGIEDGP